MIFVDTSAIYALADRADLNHAPATTALRALLESKETLLTHNYILVEAMALLQHRLGAQAALAFARDATAFDVIWIDEPTHRMAVHQFGHPGRKISLVDQVSFLVMRTHHVDTAFAFDQDFVRAGFRIYRPAH